jgi:hypothetical protein
MSSFDGITLKFSESTKSKIAAYAVLSRQNVDAVIGQLEGLIDEALKEKCIELLGGGSTGIGIGVYPNAVEDNTGIVPEPASPAPVRRPVKRPKSFADAHKQAAAPPPVEEAFSTVDESQAKVPHHELSDDEDTQENKELSEQVEGEEDLDPEAVEEFQAAFQTNRFKNAGNNAELFLDTAMGEPEEREDDEIPTVTRGYAGTGAYGQRPVKSTKTFESRLRKGMGARVTPHTGEED